MPYKDPEARRANTQRYYAANRERLKAAVAAYRQTEAGRETAQRERTKHKVQYRERLRAWVAVHSAQYNACRREWARAHPEVRRAGSHRRRALLRGVTGQFTAAEWLALCAQYGYQCLACGETKPLTVDHVVPLFLGGSNSIENIQPLCRSCNARKGIRSADYRPGRE